MNRSYRLKMEQLLHEHKLTKELLISCLAKYDKKASDLAYKEKQYRNIHHTDSDSNYKQELNELIEYRKPFVDVLMERYNMTLAEIKYEIAAINENKISTKKIVEQIRDMIEEGDYTFI